MSQGVVGTRLQPAPRLKRRARKLSSDSGCDMGRQRTVSSDSGCEVNWEQTVVVDHVPAQLEDALHTWAFRIDSVLRQEVERARQVTEVVKRSLILADGEKRESILAEWRRQMEDVLDFTQDLVECVNNDTKDVLWETAKGSGSESTSTLEEVTEDMEKEDEEEEADGQLMALFMTDQRRKEERRRHQKRTAASCGTERHLRDLYTLCRRSGCRRIAQARRKKTRDDGPENVAACAKLHRQLAAQKRRHRRRAADRKRVSVSDIFQDAIAMKMFQSVFDPEDILEDWNWHLDEDAICWENLEVVTGGAATKAASDEVEDIFGDWRWAMEEKEEEAKHEARKNDAMKVRFYDTHGIDEGFNDFNFWRRETELTDIFTPAAEDDEDAWSLWTEWGSVNEILANTLEAELPLEEDDAEDEFDGYPCEDPRVSVLKLEDFRLPMKRLRGGEDEDDHWSLWTEWGSVDEILDNTLEAAAATAEAGDHEEEDIVVKDEDIDSGFLGDTEEEAAAVSGGSRWDDCQFWEGSYENESILRSLMDGEVMEEEQEEEEAGGRTACYWDESRRDNREILEALVQECSPKFSGNKRKFAEEEEDDDDEDIVFEDDGDDVGAVVTKGHEFWAAEAESVNNDSYGQRDEEELDEEDRLCSCESGIFWLSTEDNRLIAESLVAAEQSAAASAQLAGTEYWEISEIARALVNTPPAVDSHHEVPRPFGGENRLEPKTIGKDGDSAAEDDKESEDYFQDWRRNLASPKKSRKRKAGGPVRNIADVFWSITLEPAGRQGPPLAEELGNLPAWDSPDVFADSCDLIESSIPYSHWANQSRDPANIFRTWRFIFNEPQSALGRTVDDKWRRLREEGDFVPEDMEDIYSEWAGLALKSGRSQRRGRRRRGGLPREQQQQRRTKLPAHQQTVCPPVAARRPRSPPVSFCTIRPIEGERSSWIDSSLPKMGRKASTRRPDKTRRRLYAKIFPKQPQ